MLVCTAILIARMIVQTPRLRRPVIPPYRGLLQKQSWVGSTWLLRLRLRLVARSPSHGATRARAVFGKAKDDA